MNIFGDPINDRIENVGKGLGKLETRLKVITSLLLVMKEDAPRPEGEFPNAEIKEIRTLVRNLFYEVTYVYYNIKRNLKPDDQSKIKKLVDSKIVDLNKEPTAKNLNNLSKNECAFSILS